MKKKILFVLVVALVGITTATFTLARPTVNAQSKTSDGVVTNIQTAQENIAEVKPTTAQPKASPKAVSPKAVAPAVSNNTSSNPSANEPQITPLPEEVACTNSIPASCTPAPEPENPPAGLTEEPMPLACTNSIPHACYYVE